MRKVQKFNLVWSALICFVLIYQFSIMRHMLFNFVWSPMEYIKPLVEDRLLSFVQGRVVFGIIVGIVILLVEWVVFFVIGTKLWKRFKVNQTESKLQHYQTLWLMASLILSGVMVLAVVFTMARYGLTVQSLLNNVGMKSVTEISNEILALVKTTEFNNLLDVEVTINQVVEIVKENSALYKLAMETFSSYNFSAIVYRLWHLLLVLGYGANVVASIYQLRLLDGTTKVMRD